MKKLSLEMLRLTSEEVLQRSQMKMVLGGGRFYCTCSGGSVGSWQGTYNSAQGIANAIASWCGSGEGSCSAVPQQ